MILALDFDGVIWDSVGECYEIARRAYQKLSGTAGPDVKEAFGRGRWLVRCGGDFLTLLRLAQENPGRDWAAVSKMDFADAHQVETPEFERQFYAQRELMRLEEPQLWLSLQRPYPQFLAELPALRQNFAELVLCTTKDEASARQLLSSVGLEMSIWGREKGVDKGEQIRDLCRQRGLEGHQVAFVDDLLDNLFQVKPTGARLFLADWGYNTATEQAQARQQGIAVVSAHGLAQQLLCA